MNETDKVFQSAVSKHKSKYSMALQERKLTSSIPATRDFIDSFKPFPPARLRPPHFRQALDCRTCRSYSLWPVALDTLVSGEENPWADADWNGSWKRNSVTEEQWNTLRKKLIKEADTGKRPSLCEAQWNEARAADGLSTIAHTAYHLGAIRQIIAKAG